MVIDLQKFVLRFADEARDIMQRLNDALTLLESRRDDSAAINGLFRSTHTIKGSARLLKLSTITETAHQLEEVIAALQDHRIQYTPALGQVLHQAADALAQLIDRLAASGDPAKQPLPDDALLRALIRAATGDADNSAGSNIAPPPVLQDDPGELKTVDTVRIRLEKLDQLIKLMGEVVSSHASLRQRLIELRFLERDLSILAPDADLSALRHFSWELKDNVQTQESLMMELHDRTLTMRMLPLNIVFEPAARLVRELARSIGKQVECQVSGAEIELDRQIIDKLADPIVHLIRNAVDHGLERPDIRLAAGKSVMGILRLAARQEGGNVVIDISDDGSGIPLSTVLDKAIRKGLVSPEDAERLSEREIIDLIFLPGFSTSALITDLSGRGVGMDVVKQSIQHDLRGEVHVATRIGKGTTFTLRLPTTLAVMRVLLVEVDGMPFGFTAQQVEELLHLSEDALCMAADRATVRLRDEYIPVTPLASLLKIPDRLIHRRRKRQLGMMLVVLRVGNERFAVRVDDLLDERDMVIKPLPEHLRRINPVAGMVITGKNELVNILHAPSLLELARQTNALESKLHDIGPAVHHILVVDDSLNTRELEREILLAHGYAVTVAKDGDEGLSLALEQSFDAVIADVDMPGLNGFELTARLRGIARYQQTPILIVTAREQENDKQRGIEAGADAYIVKRGFDQNNLVASLRALLG